MSDLTSSGVVEAPPVTESSGFVRGLGLFDSTMIVVGSMIGSGIFIVSADIARHTGSTGGLLAAWVISGVLTVAAAEVVVGLALIVSIFRTRRNIDVDEMNILRG